MSEVWPDQGLHRQVDLGSLVTGLGLGGMRPQARPHQGQAVLLGQEGLLMHGASVVNGPLTPASHFSHDFWCWIHKAFFLPLLPPFLWGVTLPLLSAFLVPRGVC